MASARPLALITGASSGLGAEFARQLAARSFDLLLVARRGDRLEALARELQSRYTIEAQPLVADLTSEAGVKAVEQFMADTQNLELLVNNAGFGTRGRFFDTGVAAQDAMHRLHVMATVRLTHVALAKMTARRKGAVINVSSMAAFAPRVGNTSYYATKAWMNAFTEGLYMELESAGSPVRVQALCPGFTITEFHDAMGVDRKVVPSYMWMSAENVVAASLEGLARGELLVVPGLLYKFFYFIERFLPRSFLRMLAIRHRMKWEPQ
jgi:hypothetical protein